MTDSSTNQVVSGSQSDVTLGVNKNDRATLLKYCKILSLFMDNMTDNELSPFGIHQISEVGYKFKKQPGDWYGP